MKEPVKNITENANWMPCPKAVEATYPGLAYICPLNELIIVKQTDNLHNLIGDKNTGYTIFNNEGQKVFLAVQNRRCRTFLIKIFNHYGNEIIQVERAYRNFLNTALVWAPPGNFVGVVKERRSCISTYRVKNWYGSHILELKAYGKCNLMYKIRQNGRVGTLKKNWVQNLAANVKNFGMDFPREMNIMDKVALLGACFLIGCVEY